MGTNGNEWERMRTGDQSENARKVAEGGRQCCPLEIKNTMIGDDGKLKLTIINDNHPCASIVFLGKTMHFDVI